MSEVDLILMGVDDPTQVSSWSGTPAAIHAAMRANGLDVAAVGRLHRSPTLLPRRLGHKLFPHRIKTRALSTPPDSRLLAAQARRQLRTLPNAPILSLTSLPTTFLPHDYQYSLWTDAIVPLLADYYPEYSGWSRRQYRSAIQLEQRSLQRASHVIFSSEWARKSAVAAYDLAPRRTHVVNFGANHFPSTFKPHPKFDQEQLNLLIVASNWERKGVDVAISTQQALVRHGIPARLDIVGASVPPNHRLPNGVRHHGWLDRDQPSHQAHLAELFQSADIFLLPTMADCSPMVLSEAAAYGLPSVATNTGGVASIIDDGKTGLLASQSTADAFFEAIMRIASATTLDTLSKGARHHFETSLNWQSATHRVLEIIGVHPLVV